MAASTARVILLEPEIPWNTGNAGRSVLAAGAELHLVNPAFSLDEKAVRRAGLDYWKHVPLSVWRDWSQVEDELLAGEEPWLISPEGSRAPWEVDLSSGCPTFVFGTESVGLPDSVRRRYAHRCLSLPMAPGIIRSLNLSTTVGIVLWEQLRQSRGRQSRGEGD